MQQQMLATSSSGVSTSDHVEYLRRSLQHVNDELQNTFDSEFRRLKEEERRIQDILKLKTRAELLHTMQKELEMDNLSTLDTSRNNNSALLSSSNVNLFQSHASATNTQLNESVKWSDECLNQSQLVLDKLMRDSQSAVKPKLNASATSASSKVTQKSKANKLASSDERARMSQSLISYINHFNKLSETLELDAKDASNISDRNTIFMSRSSTAPSRSKAAYVKPNVVSSSESIDYCSIYKHMNHIIIIIEC